MKEFYNKAVKLNPVIMVLIGKILNFILKLQNNGIKYTNPSYNEK